MKYDDFSEASPGQLVPTVYGARAFVPTKLPPKIDLASVALRLADASGSIGELKGACRRLTNPYIIIRPLQRLEAQTSSAMEGTHTTANKLALAEAGVDSDRDPETREVTNYIHALQNAISSLDELPITHRTLKTAHETLLKDAGRERGEDKLPGEFKRNQNMIGGRTLETARFIPATPAATPDCISDLEAFINAERDPKLALIDLALAHYQFETIHPFADGNGRVGRMLISLMAVSKGLLDIPALFVSPALEGVKDEYIDRMYRVSAFGEWTEWLNFFLEAVSRTAQQTIGTIDRIIQLQDDYKARAAGASTSTNLLTAIDMLFEVPVLRPKNLVQRAGITDAAARGILSKLVELDILVEIDIYPKAWLAQELMSLSEPSR
ncbi:Fic family protein [Litoreibacter ascidiaceicola]|uniref:Fic family protein n=1 Tax=Litoreibacter ascidiaceicola TaxID=1486859 RepID=A0A1M4YK51_9RHOB|nr:Fic family protein [Litoreibacter ascidiaceicola]SHF05776.1 Fic family protein [Litoreibacter ascidiaceicola]